MRIRQVCIILSVLFQSSRRRCLQLCLCSPKSCFILMSCYIFVLIFWDVLGGDFLTSEGVELYGTAIAPTTATGLQPQHAVHEYLRSLSASTFCVTQFFQPANDCPAGEFRFRSKPYDANVTSTNDCPSECAESTGTKRD